MTADVLVVGTGLLGTSLGLALRPERDVLLADRSPESQAVAVRRGAGRAWDGQERAALVVVATSPSSVAAVLTDLRSRAIGSTYTHVTSVQSGVQREVEAHGAAVSDVCGGHPMAGRERSGPDAAVADLFVGRPWAVCPGPRTSRRAVDDVAALAVTVGASPVEMSPDEHDRLVALVSHLPQVAASALAARLLDREGEALPLAGPGLQDSTRLAASDPGLWREVLLANAANLAPLVQGLGADLTAAGDALARVAADGPAGADPRGDRGRSADEVAASFAPVLELLERGVRGRRAVPVKRGDLDAAFTVVAVSVPDAPGRLAALLTAAGDGGVNVEDVRVEHVPGRPYGVVELAVRAEARAAAEDVLRRAGWHVLGHR